MNARRAVSFQILALMLANLLACSGGGGSSSDTTGSGDGNAPVANEVKASTAKNTSVKFNLDCTGEGELEYILTSKPTNGKASLSGKSLTYTPTTGFSGNDEGAYKCKTDTAESEIAKYVLTVNNDDTTTGTTACTFTYSDWTECKDGTQTRTYTKTPENCTGSPSTLEQTCTTTVTNQAPSAPTYTGTTTLTEPCSWGSILSATDTDGSIASYVQTGGNLPPSYTLSGNTLRGPPTNVDADTSYTASFAAVDDKGLQGEASSITLTCKNLVRPPE